MSDPPRIYRSLSEYTPLQQLYATLLESTPTSQNIPPFSTKLMYICDPPRIYPSLPEYTPFSTTVCDTPRNYPSLREYTPLFTTMCSLSLSEYIPRDLSTMFQESTPQSLNMPHFLETTCNCERICHSFPEL